MVVLEFLCFIGLLMVAVKERWARWLCLVWFGAAFLDAIVR